MKKLALIAALVAVPVIAIAQQVANVTTCTVLLDGGTQEICGTVATNFQPIVANCQISVPGASTAATTINVLGSPDGTHFGLVADAGLSITTVLNGDGGPLALGPTFAIYPTDPYQSIQITATGTAIDGGAGGPGALSCYVGVINAQTMHAKQVKFVK